MFSSELGYNKYMTMTKQGWIKRKANGNGVAWNKGLKTGIRSPLYSSVILVCRECIAPFIARNYRKEVAMFCSKQCAWQNRNEGKTSENKRIRMSALYKAWRTFVFERDNYCCIECKDHNYEGRGSTLILHADHIKPFALFPELRFAIDNGRTLCIDCHKKTDTYGGRTIYKKVCLAVA